LCVLGGNLRSAAAEDVGPSSADEPHEVYTVRPGDTLIQVARRHGTSVERLLSLNVGLADADHIFADQHLRVPIGFEHAPEPIPPTEDGEGGAAAIEASPAPDEEREGWAAAVETSPPPRDEDDGQAAAGEPTPAAPDVVREDLAPVTCDLPQVAEEEGIALPSHPIETSPGRLVFASRVSDEFEAKTREVARRLGMDPDHLMTIMHYETGGSFRPSIRNPYSQAVGLIQFLPSTARLLGTSAEELETMSAVDQLDWVEAYLTPFRGRLGSIEDAYMAVLYPAAVGCQADYVLFRRGSSAYDRNPGLDRDDDGLVTRGEVCAAVATVLQRGIDARAAADTR
jgi:LysM repeat protein